MGRVVLSEPLEDGFQFGHRRAVAVLEPGMLLKPLGKHLRVGRGRIEGDLEFLKILVEVRLAVDKAQPLRVLEVSRAG